MNKIKYKSLIIAQTILIIINLPLFNKINLSEFSNLESLSLFLNILFAGWFLNKFVDDKLK